MSAALDALAILLGALALILAGAALPALWRAWRLGVPVWYGGLGLHGAPSRHVPDAARPHLRHARRRWFAAIGVLALAAVASALGGGLR